MTVVNAAGYALAQLRSTVDVFSFSTSTALDMFQVGRALESRILAAQGMALGFYPREEAIRWIDYAYRRIDDQVPSVRDEAGLPSLMRTEQLISVWGDTASLPPNSRRQFRRTLTLRGYLDADPILSRFYAAILFGSEADWEFLMAEEQASVEHAASTLLDGAYRSTNICAYALGLFAGRSGEASALWPSIVNPRSAVRFSGYDWLEKSKRPYADVVRDLVASAYGQRTLDDYTEGSIVHLLESILEFWAGTPARLAQDASPQVHDRDARVRALVPTASLTVFATQLVLGTPWTSLLWRLAPTEQGPTNRLEDAARITLAYLGSLEDRAAAGSSAVETTAVDAVLQLTLVELIVLRLAMQGRTPNEIALLVGSSGDFVQTVLYRLSERLNDPHD